jgi:hypothetical protein
MQPLIEEEVGGKHSKYVQRWSPAPARELGDGCIVSLIVASP